MHNILWCNKSELQNSVSGESNKRVHRLVAQADEALNADGVEDQAQPCDINSRCCLRLVNEVISRFDEKKRELLESIGFVGLLKFLHHSQTNRKFAIWLLSKVDESTQSVVIDSCRSFSFGKEDVRMVFGIPSFSNRVVQTD